MNPHATYVQAKVAQCLNAHHLNVGSGGPDGLLEPLNRINGLTGSISALRKGEGSHLLGPTFEGVMLLFETNAASAAHVAGRAITAAKKAEILIGDEKSVRPPERDVRAFDQVNGNVIVLWDYPAIYRRSSRAIVKNCLAQAKVA